jgi:ATP adenylyltransferase
MDRLWSPWRLEYVTGSKPDAGCVLCEAPHRPAQQSLLLFEGRAAYVILNLYPYNNGHVMVVPYRHVANLAGLTPGELQEVALLTQRSEVALVEAYQPQGINAGINLGRPAGAGILEHLHVHLVPRWNGDTNFMTVVGDTRVLPEDLASSAARLRPIYARLEREAAAGAASPGSGST